MNEIHKLSKHVNPLQRGVQNAMTFPGLYTLSSHNVKMNVIDNNRFSKRDGGDVGLILILFS